MLLFSGSEAGGRNDETWVYDLSDNTWTLKSPATKPSSMRINHAMASLGGRQVLLFAGSDGIFPYDETWVYAGLLSAQEQIDILIGEVEAAESLNNGQANALTSKLEAAKQNLDQGNTTAAINQLQAFINQVNDFINSGVLTAAEGQPLIDSANDIIDAINNGLYKIGSNEESSQSASLPAEYRLDQNYPNPFSQIPRFAGNPSTTIRFALPEAAEALGISPRTADRLWLYARTWLKAELQSGP